MPDHFDVNLMLYPEMQHVSTCANKDNSLHDFPLHFLHMLINAKNNFSQKINEQFFKCL